MDRAERDFFGAEGIVYKSRVQITILDGNPIDCFGIKQAQIGKRHYNAHKILCIKATNGVT